LFYFGYVLTKNFFVYFGVNVDMLGFTAQDILLRSVSAVYGPSAALLGAVLLGAALDRWLTRHIDAIEDRRAARRRTASRLVRLAGLLLLLNGGLGILVNALAQFEFFLAAPLSLGLGATLLWYRRHRWIPRSSSAAERQLAACASAMLIFLSLFWATGDYAQAVGLGLATRLSQHLTDLPGVIVDSPQRLLIEGSNVQEIPLRPGPSGGPNYRYEGFRLLAATSRQMFLIPASWTEMRGAVVMLPNDQQVRLSFYPG
jgi:hypothetical protein